MNDIKKAIEIINDVTWNDNGRHYGQISKVRELVISVLEEKLNNGWIPCSERLPKEHRSGFFDYRSSDKVLVQLKNGDMAITRYWSHSDCFYKGIVPWIDLKQWEDVVAWQPLPKKYDGGLKDE